MTEQLINISLTPVEANLFKQFRQYQNLFQAMLDAGLLNFRRGTITFHYDINGKIVKFERRQVENMPSYPHLTVIGSGIKLRNGENEKRE